MPNPLNLWLQVPSFDPTVPARAVIPRHMNDGFLVPEAIGLDATEALQTVNGATGPLSTIDQVLKPHEGH